MLTQRSRWPAALGLASLLACTAPVAKPPSQAPRLAIMAPAAAEIAVALGLDDSIVAVGDFVAWPPVLRAKPKIGAYDAPNVEGLLDLGVTHFVSASSQAAQQAHAALQKLGITVLTFDTGTLEGMLAAAQSMGEAFERPQEGAALRRRLAGSLEQMRSRTAGLQRPPVLIVVGRDPLFAAGPSSHLHALVEAAGGRNILADASSAYQMTSFEVVLERAPQIIIDTSSQPCADGPCYGARVGEPWSAWPMLSAVASRRVYHVHPQRLSVPGPRLPAMLDLMAKLIHPELFGEVESTQLQGLSEASQ